MNNIRTMKNNGGFTLIELMIVIAILAILLAIAIPAYQDYTIRAKTSECANAVAPVKVGVSEYAIARGGSLPANNAEAGISGFTTDYCTSVNVGANGVITVTVDQGGVGAEGALGMQWEPTIDANRNVIWNCNGTGLTKYVPAECR